MRDLMDRLDNEKDWSTPDRAK